MKRGATGAFFHSLDMIKSLSMDCHTILIVEDEANVRRMLRSAVESLGAEYIVLDVPSAEEALLVASHQPIQLLVTDIRLAGISGLELIKKIRQKKQDLKVILITGLTEEKIRNQIAMAGAEATFFKPINMDQFLNEVQLILGKVDGEPTFTPGASIEEKMVPVDYQEILSHLVTAGKAEVALFIDLNGILINPGNKQVVDVESIDSILKIHQEINTLSQALLYTPGRGWLYLSGNGLDVWLFPVDTGCYLVQGGSVGPDERNKRLLQMSEVISAAEKEPVESLPITKSDELNSSSWEEAPKQSEQELDQLDHIFNPQAVAGIKREQADSFWESATQTDEPAYTGSHTLNYEQALRLGITLDEDGGTEETNKHED